MATTYFKGIEVEAGRSVYATMCRRIHYATNPKKTRDGELVSSFGCSAENAPYEMRLLQNDYESTTGKVLTAENPNGKKSYILMQFRQSFKPGEVTYEQAHEISCKLAERFLGEKYQYVVATHVNTRNPHSHIIFNVVGSDLKKFHQNKFTPRRLAELSDQLCEEYGLTVVVPSHEKREKGYTGPKTTSFRTILKTDIDRFLQESKNYDEFVHRMNEIYYVETTGKYLKFRHRTNGQERFIRAYSLGEEYTEESLRARAVGLPIPKTAAKEKTIQESDDPLTYTQRRKNVEAMLAAAGFMERTGIRSNEDFEKKVAALTGQAVQLQPLMEKEEKQLNNLKIVGKGYDVIRQYEALADEYRTTLLPERFMQSHQNELDLYFSAVENLKSRGFIPDSAGEAKFQSLLTAQVDKISTLQVEFDSLHRQIDEVNQIKKVIGRVLEDKKIVTERKGGHHIGW